MYVLLYVFAPYIFTNFNIMTYDDNKNGVSRLHLKFDLSVMLQPHFFLNHPYRKVQSKVSTFLLHNNSI